MHGPCRLKSIKKSYNKSKKIICTYSVFTILTAEENLIQIMGTCVPYEHMHIQEECIQKNEEKSTRIHYHLGRDANKVLELYVTFILLSTYQCTVK
jgi:hypothetical protein